MKPDEYQCENCKGVFTSLRTDEEAMAEHVEHFGTKCIDPGVVCDDCHKKIMAWWKSLPEAQKWRLRNK